MKSLLLASLLLTSYSALASTIQFEVESFNPKAVCSNTKELTKLLSPYVNISLSSCTSKLIDTGWAGTETYSVNIEVDSKVIPCDSEENQAILFNIPTNTYPHWKPAARFSYIDKILNDLEFKSHIAVTNIGPNQTPKYKQIVFIPKCSFR